jgi:hypothetical protein
MRRWIVAAAAAALSIGIAAPIARAEGINLSWDDCGSFGVANKAFACDVNDAVFTLVGSFILDAPDSVLGLSAEVVIDAEPALLPNWWKFPSYNPYPSPPGACQDSGQILLDDGQSTSCPTAVIDPESGWGYGWFPMSGSPSEALTGITTGSTSITESVVVPGSEYAVLRLTLRPARTIGPGACDGCSTPMTITLSLVTMIRSDGNESHRITDPATRNVVTWHGLPTPVLPTTWGAIKRLYR